MSVQGRAETKYGALTLNASSQTLVYFESEGLLIVNNADYRVTGHCCLWKDGKWHIGEEGNGHRYGYDLGLTRPYHSRYCRIVSVSARRKLSVAVEEAINGWARYRFDELQTAQEHYVKGSIERVKKEIAELV